MLPSFLFREVANGDLWPFCASERSSTGEVAKRVRFRALHSQVVLKIVIAP